MVDTCEKKDWTTECQQIAYASSINNRRLERAFSTFRRRESNSVINFADQRDAPRHAFNEPVILALSPGEYEGFNGPVQLALNGWTVNLSKSGLGVICGRKLYPVNQINDETPLVLTSHLIRPGTELRVIFLRDGYEVKGLLSKVVRLHDACEEMLDIGIQFSEQDREECECRSLEPFVEWLHPYAALEAHSMCE